MSLFLITLNNVFVAKEQLKSIVKQ